MFTGHIDHAARVMRAITWNKSFRGMQNGDGAKDDFGTVEHETHATVLDKLLAWEKKLYDEVKVRQNVSVASMLVQFLHLCLFIMVILFAIWTAAFLRVNVYIPGSFYLPLINLYISI